MPRRRKVNINFVGPLQQGVRRRTKPRKKRTKSRRTRKMKPGMNMSGLMSTSMQVCSLTNPFCPDAKGARWPDNSYTKSVPYCFEYNQNINTDTNGNASSLYGPSLDYNYCAGVVTAGVAAFTTWGPNPGIGTQANVQRWRLTSYGIKINAQGPYMTTIGRIRVRLLSPSTGASYASVPINSIYADAALDEPVVRYLEKDLWINAAPLGDNARLFQAYPTSGTVSSWVNPGWQTIVLSVDGGLPSTAVLSVTVFYNYEIVYNDASGMQLFAAAPPTNNPVVQNSVASTMESVGNFIEGTAQKVDSLFKSKAFQMLASAGAGYLSNSPAVAAGTYGALTNYSHASKSSAPMMIMD